SGGAVLAAERARPPLARGAAGPPGSSAGAAELVRINDEGSAEGGTGGLGVSPLNGPSRVRRADAGSGYRPRLRFFELVGGVWKMGMWFHFAAAIRQTSTTRWNGLLSG